MFKTELHLHTAGVSRCASATVRQAVDDYINNGYDTIIITNHLSPTFFKVKVPESMTEWKDIADFFMSDYREAKEYAAGRINVLLGMELRTRENINDYLVYGIDEQFVYDLGNVMDKTHKEMSEYIRNSGALFFQAHPFRNTMVIVNPKYLDGIEVCNYSYKHESRNDIAELWAKKHNLLKSYGTDYHSTEHMCGAGILTDYEIKTPQDVVRTLKDMTFKYTDGKKIYSPK